MEKTARKKQLILEKLGHFKNCQKWPPSKAYRHCKIVGVGQNLNMQKNMLKTFLQDIAVVLLQKTGRKNS